MKQKLTYELAYQLSRDMGHEELVALAYATEPELLLFDYPELEFWYDT